VYWFFFFIFSCGDFFFCLYFPPPSPNKFSNGPSLRAVNNNKLHPHVGLTSGIWSQDPLVRDECCDLCTGHPLNSKGYLMFTNQAQVWTLENATQYFFFFGDTLENCLPLLGLVGTLFREKSGFMLHFSSEKWNFMLIKQVLQIIRYDHLPCRFGAAW